MILGGALRSRDYNSVLIDQTLSPTGITWWGFVVLSSKLVTYVTEVLHLIEYLAPVSMIQTQYVLVCLNCRMLILCFAVLARRFRSLVTSGT